MRIARVGVLSFFATFAAACMAAPSVRPEPAFPPAAMTASAPPPPSTAEGATRTDLDLSGALADATNAVAPPSPAAIARRAAMMIYAADITLAVYDVTPRLAQVETLARAAGGFLVRRDDTSLVVRVPAARFDETVQAVLKLGDVLHHQVTAQDVTEEYADLDVQMRNLRAERDRLAQLLDKATTAQDAVAVEKELARVTGELERIEGRMKFLRDRVAFSTLTVRFEARREESSPGTVKLPFPWLDQLGLAHLLSL